jgi:hypothetical protein
MTGVSFKMRGVNEMIQKAKRADADYQQRLKRAMREEAEIEMTEAKRRTPVDTGALRASGHVEGPDKNGQTFDVTWVFGGAAAPYAIYVHENEEAFHPVGQAKFLESVVNESRSSMAARLAARMRER